MKNYSTAAEELTAKFQALAYVKYSFYLKYVHKEFRSGRHIQLLADKLQEIERKQAQGIPTYTIITMPPRHSKSMTTSETFPSWFIGRNPERRVIQVSYGENLAKKAGRRNLDKIREYGKGVFDLEIDPEQRSVLDWKIAGHKGGMISRGLGGSITGEGADLMIIDDPIKNRREAESLTYRDFVWDEWESTLSTRLQPGAAVIAIFTRWHEDDLVGRLLEREPGKWDVISLPAIAEEGKHDLLGRKPGEALWPEYGFDEEWAAEKKLSVGSRTWESLYQQNPRPAEGTIFKRHFWNYYKRPPAQFDQVLQSWDCTFKDLESSDYVVGQVWGKKGANIYLLDQVRGKMNITATMQAIRNLSAKWPQAHTKLIEDKANGPAIIQLLKKEVPGLIAVEPEGGKEVRAIAAEPFVEAGNIYLPDPSIAPWVGDFVEEAAAFPNGKHDDQVDAMSQAITRFNQPTGVFIGRA